jgi:hypothetical protein
LWLNALRFSKSFFERSPILSHQNFVLHVRRQPASQWVLPLTAFCRRLGSLMKWKYLLRSTFDRLFSCLPQAIHTGILKSYANMPALTLRSGFRCYPQVFYSPLVNPAEIDISKLGQKRHLPGIAMDLALAEEWTEKLAAFASELAWMPREEPSRRVVWHETYTTTDSAYLYCLLRHLKPKRYIEVGCGVSSRVSSEAMRRNEAEGIRAESTFIEPYPGPRLEGVNLYGELLVKKIEEVPLDFFRSLGSGDVLFIDTSHVLKCQNDVEWELNHILPSLKSGVWVHIHDIYTPYEQPYDWLLGRYAPGSANEQYAVEAFLSGGDTFEVVLPLHLIGRERVDLLGKLTAEGHDRGQAIWLRKN